MDKAREIPLCVPDGKGEENPATAFPKKIKKIKIQLSVLPGMGMSSARRSQHVPSAPQAARRGGGQQGGGRASPRLTTAGEGEAQTLLQRDNPEPAPSNGTPTGLFPEVEVRQGSKGRDDLQK